MALPPKSFNQLKTDERDLFWFGTRDKGSYVGAVRHAEVGEL